MPGPTLSNRLATLQQLLELPAWDEEALHSFRIQLRGLLALLPLLELVCPDRLSLRAELKATLQGYNANRNLDVFAPYLARLDGSQPFLERLRLEAGQTRRPGKAFGRQLAKLQALNARWQHYGCQLDLPPLLTLHKQIYCDQALLRLGGVDRNQRPASANPGSRQSRVEALHRLRIALKRVRYLLELLATRDPGWRAGLKAVKGWQDRLGVIADLAALQAWLKTVQGKQLGRQIRDQRRRLQAEAIRQLPDLEVLLRELARQPVTGWAPLPPDA